MAMLTVRNVPDEVHRALRAQAALHGRSTEAEVRNILASAVKPQARLLLGDSLANLSQEAGLSNKDFDALINAQVQTAARPLSFE